MAIKYTKNKGYSLILAIQAAGHTLQMVDGAWVSSNDKAVQAIIDGHDPMPYERATLLEKVNAVCDDQLSVVTQTYPPSEVTSWAKQEADARAFTNGATASPLLVNLSSIRGESVISLCQKIIEKADAYAALVGTIVGKRQKAEKAIEAAQSIDDLLAIQYV